MFNVHLNDINIITGCPIRLDHLQILKSNMQAPLLRQSSDDYIYLWSIVARNILIQTSKSQENDRLHVAEPHAAPKACESITSLKGYNSLQASRSESDLL